MTRTGQGAVAPTRAPTRAPTDDARTIAAVTVGFVVAGLLAERLGGLAPASLALVAPLWLGLCAIVLGARRHHPHARFGAANAVTTVRAAITVLLAALAIEAGNPAGALEPPATAWLHVATGAALLALALDGIDGPLARAAGLASAFGARYDMEIDALLALVLATLIHRTGELGAWVLALGTMRYAYLAAARVVPALRLPLPPSRRRKAVCVVQIGALCAIVSPLVAPPLSTAIGLAATLALALSFGVDVRHQLGEASRSSDARRAPGPNTSAPRP